MSQGHILAHCSPVSVKPAQEKKIKGESTTGWQEKIIIMLAVGRSCAHTHTQPYVKLIITDVFVLFCCLRSRGNGEREDSRARAPFQ